MTSDLTPMQAAEGAFTALQERAAKLGREFKHSMKYPGYIWLFRTNEPEMKARNASGVILHWSHRMCFGVDGLTLEIDSLEKEKEEPLDGGHRTEATRENEMPVQSMPAVHSAQSGSSEGAV
jgi:hypothetical protein